MAITGLDNVLRRLDIAAAGMRANALAAAQEIAALLETYAKQNHPWTPDTGATDASTRGTVIDAGDIITIVLSAGMDYDKFLELARGGKWAWLWPAVTDNADAIRDILRRAAL